MHATIQQHWPGDDCWPVDNLRAPLPNLLNLLMVVVPRRSDSLTVTGAGRVGSTHPISPPTGTADRDKIMFADRRLLRVRAKRSARSWLLSLPTSRGARPFSTAVPARSLEHRNQQDVHTRFRRGAGAALAGGDVLATLSQVAGRRIFITASVSFVESGGWTMHFRSLVEFPAPAFGTTDGKILGGPLCRSQGNLCAAAPTNNDLVGAGVQSDLASSLSR